MRALPKTAGWSDIKQIVVLRALKLGDLLHAVPALRALRAAFPQARVSLVGLSWSEEFVNRFPKYLDEFICLPGIPGFPEQPAKIERFPSFLSQMQTRQFDLAIQMQGSGDIANTIMSFWGARHFAGFYLPGQYCPDETTFLAYPEGENEIWRNLRLMEFLGIPLQGDDLELPLFDADRAEFHRIQQRFDLRRPYICIHPGASRPERRWAPENFAQVADGLAQLGFQIVLTGTAGEAEVTAAVAQRMQTPAIDLAGKTSLGSLGGLISDAQLVVSNDTGISHVATAVKTPSVILFSVPDMDRWAPKNRQRHKVLCPASSLSAQDVLAQAKNHLQTVYASAELQEE